MYNSYHKLPNKFRLQFCALMKTVELHSKLVRQFMITVTCDPCMWETGWRTRTVYDNVNGQWRF